MSRHRHSAARNGTDGAELFDLVDADNRVIGTVSRAQAHGDPSLRHRAVHVMVYDRRGSLLLQKRAAAKDIQPGKWDTSVGGHLAAGESYPAAALRETREELGLVIGADDLEPLHEYVGSSEVETEHVRSFRVRSDGPFTAPPEEIEELRFWTPEELRAALGSGVLTPVLEHELALAGIAAAAGAPRRRNPAPGARSP